MAQANTTSRDRRLAAILAADVAGYSRLTGADEEGTLAALKKIQHELTDPKIAAHGGRVVRSNGDGTLVEFASVVDAVRCAAEVQEAMAERNVGVPTDKRIEFRIGINLGDILIDEGDIFGDDVNIAARLEAMAEPGGICVSRFVRDQVRDRLDLAFEDMGKQALKNGSTSPLRTWGSKPSRIFPILFRSIGSRYRKDSCAGRAQGDGEACATALETEFSDACPLAPRGDMQFELPRAETPSPQVTVGSDEDPGVEGQPCYSCTSALSR